MPAQFAAIVTNPAKYPIMTSNGDNLAYKYTAITLYPPNRTGNAPYNNCANINQTFMNLLTQNRDP
ncbi:SusD/RagB family nutrient-binding outer membrane lipoprotein, partial [Acinetobacter baumannii]